MTPSQMVCPPGDEDPPNSASTRPVASAASTPGGPPPHTPTHKPFTSEDEGRTPMPVLARTGGVFGEGKNQQPRKRLAAAGTTAPVQTSSSTSLFKSARSSFTRMTGGNKKPETPQAKPQDDQKKDEIIRELTAKVTLLEEQNESLLRAKKENECELVRRARVIIQQQEEKARLVKDVDQVTSLKQPKDVTWTFRTRAEDETPTGRPRRASGECRRRGQSLTRVDGEDIKALRIREQDLRIEHEKLKVTNDSIKSLIAEGDAIIKTRQTEAENLRRQIESLETELRGLNTQHETLGTAIAEGQATLDKILEDSTSNQRLLCDLEAEQERLRQECETMRKEQQAVREATEQLLAHKQALLETQAQIEKEQAEKEALFQQKIAEFELKYSDEAIQKLESAVNDKKQSLSELTSQLDNLKSETEKIQAQKTHTLQDLEASLDAKRAEELKATKEVEHAQTLVINAQAEITRLETLESDLKSRIAALEGTVSKISSQIDKLTEERDQIAADRDTISSERDKLVSEREALVTERDKLVRELVSERDKVTEELHKITTDRDRVTDERDKMLAERDRLVAEIARLTAEAAAIEAKVQELKATEDVLTVRKAELANEVETLTQTLSQSGSTTLPNSMETAGEFHGVPVESVDCSPEDLQAEKERMNAEKEQIKAEKERMKAEMDKAQAELDKAQAEMDKAQAEMDKARSELERVQGERERLEGECGRYEAVLIDRREQLGVTEKALSDLLARRHAETVACEKLRDSVRQLEELRLTREAEFRSLTDKCDELTRQIEELRATESAMAHDRSRTSSRGLERDDVWPESDKEPTRLAIALETHMYNLREVHKERDAVRDVIVHLEKQKFSLIETIKNLQEEADDAHTNLSLLRTEIAEGTSKLSALRSELASATAALQLVRDEHAATKKLVQAALESREKCDSEVAAFRLTLAALRRERDQLLDGPPPKTEESANSYGRLDDEIRRMREAAAAEQLELAEKIEAAREEFTALNDQIRQRQMDEQTRMARVEEDRVRSRQQFEAAMKEAEEELAATRAQKEAELRDLQQKIAEVDAQYKQLRAKLRSNVKRNSLDWVRQAAEHVVAEVILDDIDGLEADNTSAARLEAKVLDKIRTLQAERALSPSSGQPWASPLSPATHPRFHPGSPLPLYWNRREPLALFEHGKPEAASVDSTEEAARLIADNQALRTELNQLYRRLGEQERQNL